MTDVLLTVSRVVDRDLPHAVARHDRPTPDFVALGLGLPATVLDLAAARAQSGRSGKLIERILGRGTLLAWAAFRRRRAHHVILTDGEHVGIPLAALLVLTRGKTRPRHVMIAHVLDVAKKRLPIRGLRLARAIDRFVVYARAQHDFIRRRLRVANERVVHMPFQVDHRFFDPALVTDKDRRAATLRAGDVPRPLVCSVGAERRDYRTLFDAVRDLDVDVVLTRGTVSWREHAAPSLVLPDNVREGRFSYRELRALYAAADCVVVPLRPVTFAAGVTTILEAMAMGRAVIVSRVPGQLDVVEDDETGVYVPPEDPGALKAAIVALTRDADRRARLGAAARRRVETDLTIDRYVARLRQALVFPDRPRPAT